MSTPRNPYDPPAHKGPTPPEATDPNERLKQLKIELVQQQSRRDHIARQLDELQTDITDLEQTVGEVTTTLSDYAKEIKNMHTELHGLHYFYDQKTKMVAAAIGDKKDPIDDAIQLFDQETERMTDQLEGVARARDEAQSESAKADAIQADKQAAYDGYKNYKQDTNAKLQDLEALRTTITQADDATDIATMYFLILEFKSVLQITHIVSQHQLAQDLKEKLSQLEAAKEAAREKKSAWNELSTNYDAQNATLVERLKGRRANLLAVVQALYPVESVPAK
jgi:DNA repair exonuclease SbcCD ATPase subunit